MNFLKGSSFGIGLRICRRNFDVRGVRSLYGFDCIGLESADQHWTEERASWAVAGANAESRLSAASAGAGLSRRVIWRPGARARGGGGGAKAEPCRIRPLPAARPGRNASSAGAGRSRRRCVAARRESAGVSSAGAVGGLGGRGASEGGGSEVLLSKGQTYT
jgi:hypothetical protein